MPVIPKRVVVIVNKWWECDPVMNVLLHNKARPKSLLWPTALNHPRARPADLPLPPREPAGVPRAVYTYPAVSVEIWCLADLLDDLPDRTRYQSSTERKAERLLRVFNGRYPDLVVAVGTAGFPMPVSEGARTENGSVAVGRRALIHNFHPNGTNPFSNWSAGPFDTVLESEVTPELFAELVNASNDVTSRFIVPPNQEVDKQGKKQRNEMRVIANPDAVSVGVVNVTDYKEYDQSDKAAMDSLTAHGGGAIGISLETTHGLIRAMYQQVAESDARTAFPFLFISGITDRVGHFADEVSKNEYAQNFAASHNMGVVLAWMVPNLVDALSG